MAKEKSYSKKRFREIVRVLGSYGFGHMVRVKTKSDKLKNDPKNLRLVFEELGPTFIKLGQILSTRPDILPVAYTAELSKLQDSAPDFSFETVAKIIEEELGRPIGEVFSYINKNPLASASVAQVHEATLLSGQEVILKVQRPDIEDALIEDLHILITITKKAPTTLRDVFLDPVEALEEILESTKIELDFNNEVNAMLRFKTENESIKCIAIPEIYLPLCTKRLITMEQIKGFKITDQDSLEEAGYVPEDIGQKLILSYLYQIFTHGFFHGDPHPGNLIIHEGKIYFIDFGIMGTLTHKSKKALNNLLKAMVKKDITELVNLILNLSDQKGPVDKNELYDDMQHIVSFYLQSSLQHIEVSKLFMDLFEAARKNNLKLPKEFTTLLKSLLILEGVLSELAPELSIMEIAKDYLKQDMDIPILPKFSLDALVMDSYSFVRESIRIPAKISTILDNFISGRGKIKLDIVNFESKWLDFNKMVNRMVYALVVSAIIIASALIIRSGQGPTINGISIVGMMGFGLAGLLGIWLLFSIIKSGKI